MLNQDFKTRNFQYLLTRSDFIAGKIYKNINQLLPELLKIETSIKDDTFNFDPFESGLIRKKRFFTASTLKNRLILKKINNNICRIYRVKPATRNHIIKNLTILLKEECPFYIIKSDIKSFYESINLKDSIKGILDNDVTSLDTKKLLLKLVNDTKLAGSYGLPRGINLSSTLSEIFMKSFDLSIKNINGVYYYGRFVDDIIIFTFKNPKNILKIFKRALKQKGMTINSVKTRIMSFGFENSPPNLVFDFLGYNFTKLGKHLHIQISKKKINKIKTRIIKSFLHFKHDVNETLLIDRIRFLTGNYLIEKAGSDRELKSGIFYNYPLAKNCLDQLQELDNFLRMNVFSKNGVVSRKKIPLREEIKLKLKKYSFSMGYKNRIPYEFTMPHMAKIKKCWQYD